MSNNSQNKMQALIRSIAYKTPNGFVDMPYCYLFDATALTDGSSYPNLSVVTDNDSDFIMRRIVGADLCLNANATGKFQVRDESQVQFFQSPIRPGRLPNASISGSWPVMPEKVYPASSQINFDLLGVSRNFTADTPDIYNSFFGFWGVRRYSRNAVYVHNTDYAYHELPYTYQEGLTIDWGHWTAGSGGIANNVRQFGIQILETDFELCAIGVTYADGTLVSANDFQLSLYDPSGTRKLSNLPVNLPYFNFNAPSNYGAPVFPVPSIVYPMKGHINFEITSMLPFGTVKSYVLHFMGIWRAHN